MTGKLILLFKHSQCAKKGPSHSPVLVDFAIGLVNSVFFCLMSKLSFLQNSKFTELWSIPLIKKIWGGGG